MDDGRTETPQGVVLREERTHVGVWRVPPDLRPDRTGVLVSILARRLAATRFDALQMETLGRSFRERTARLLVAFQTTGSFAPVLMEFVTAVEIDGVRYRRVRDECDLCSYDGEWYCAVLTIAVERAAFFPRKHSEDVEFVFVAPEP